MRSSEFIFLQAQGYFLVMQIRSGVLYFSALTSQPWVFYKTSIDVNILFDLIIDPSMDNEIILIRFFFAISWAFTNDANPAWIFILGQHWRYNLRFFHNTFFDVYFLSILMRNWCLLLLNFSNIIYLIIFSLYIE